jgi:hypothetical protein
VKLGYGIPGLFIGIALGNIVVVILFVRVILTTNWERIVEEVQERIE